MSTIDLIQSDMSTIDLIQSDMSTIDLIQSDMSIYRPNTVRQSYSQACLL